jgi:rare lipoprotein A
MPWRLHLDVHSVCDSPQTLALCGVLLLAQPFVTHAASITTSGTASWYGEAERGKLMANGKPFNPDSLTAASWFYPLGTRLEVSLRTTRVRRTVTVTVTDRGPALQLVKEGRLIDLSHAAFARLASPERGLIQVSIHRIDSQPESDRTFSPAKESGITPPKEMSIGAVFRREATAVSRFRLPGDLSSKMELPKDKIFCMDGGGDSLYEATPAGSGFSLCHRYTDR